MKQSSLTKEQLLKCFIGSASVVILKLFWLLKFVKFLWYLRFRIVRALNSFGAILLLGNSK
jgi:hypothetical protein